MTTNLGESPHKSKLTEQNSALYRSSGFVDSCPILTTALQNSQKAKLINDLLGQAGDLQKSLSIVAEEWRPDNTHPEKELPGAYLDLCHLGQMLGELQISMPGNQPVSPRVPFGKVMNNIVVCFTDEYPNLNFLLHIPSFYTNIENVIEWAESYEEMLKYFLSYDGGLETPNNEAYHKYERLNHQLQKKLRSLKFLRLKRLSEEKRERLEKLSETLKVNRAVFRGDFEEVVAITARIKDNELSPEELLDEQTKVLDKVLEMSEYINQVIELKCAQNEEE